MNNATVKRIVPRGNPECKERWWSTYRRSLMICETCASTDARIFVEIIVIASIILRARREYYVYGKEMKPF